MIGEGEKIINMQIAGIPEIFMPISDPVFPYATDASADVEVLAAYALSCAYLHYVKKQDPPKTTHRIINS